MQTITHNQTEHIVNRDLIKQANYAHIYKLIEQHAPISRVKIAKVSHLTPTNIAKITKELLSKGLISETERQISTGGRCAISLQANTEKIFVIAIKIARQQLSIGRYDLGGKKSVDKIIDIKHGDAELLSKLLHHEVQSLLNTEQQQGHNISAIAVTMPALLDLQQGSVIYSAANMINDLELVKLLQESFKIPTFIANHSRAYALAEHYFGATKNSRDSVVITIQHGVSAGVMVQGEPLLGANFNVGEIGHIQVNPNGERCHCGNIGCLESELNDDVILTRVEQAIKQGEPCPLDASTLNIDNIYQAAAYGDPLCSSIVTQAANYLGKVIAMLINILNPEKIVLAGKITRAQDSFFDAIESHISKQSLPEFQKNVHITTSQLQLDSTIAAFALAKQAIYQGEFLEQLNVA